MEWIKKNIKIILICLLALCLLSKCTQSCNRANEITKLNEKIVQLDSIIDQKDSMLINIEYKNANISELLESEKRHNANFTNIATDNQTNLYDKIEKIEKEKSILLKENNKLKKQLDSIKNN